MEMLPLESSMIRAVGYDIFRQILQIQFQSAEVFAYMDVPEKIYEELMEAPSAGRYFQDCIRDRYHYIRIK